MGAPKVRAVLAMLLLHPDHVVPADRLADAIWGDERPGSAVNTLQGYVSQLRRALGADRIQTRSPGYVLAVEGGLIDAVRFESLLKEGQRARADGRPERSAAALAQALELWRGDALADFSYADWAQPHIARLEELRLIAVEEGIGARLDLGQHGEILGELDALVIAHPLRERLWAARMLALYRSGRQAEALRSFQDLRRHLVEELGIEPSPTLVALEDSILRQDPGLQGRSPGATPSNLPASRTAFVGRHEELVELEKLAQEPGLVSIVGPGGVGKTRLALEVSHRMRGHGADVWLAELAPLGDPSLLAQVVADACGVQEEPERTPTETLVASLRGWRGLLVLDNCEHLLEAVAALAEVLMRAAPQLSIVVTSRQPLRLEGERVWRAVPLDLPPSDDLSPQELLDFDSVRLFVARATDADRRFTLSGENGAAVSHICRRLDGIPLALELAAARAAFLAVPELARRLADGFALLSGGSRSAPLRHQRLEAAIDWGYGLLEPREQTLFSRLSVFAGTFTLAAAEAVCSGRGVEPEEVMHSLAGLVDKSFVSADLEADVTRYRMLETLREYGARHLTADDASTVQGRLLHWGLDLAHEAEPHLKDAGQQEWLEVVDDDLDNLRAVLAWAHGGADPPGGLEIVVALQRFWELRRVKEGRAWVEALLHAGGPGLPPAMKVRALTVAGVLAAHEGDHVRVRSVYEECLAVSRQFALAEGIGKALLGLGHVAFMQGDYGTARRLCGESLELGRRDRDLRTVAASLNVLGRVAHFQGRYGEADAILQESLAVRTQLGDREWIAVALGALGDLAYRTGAYAVGRSYCDESLRIAREIGAGHQQAWAVSMLSELDLAAGDTASAAAGLESALGIFRDRGDRSCTTRALYRLSRVEAARGDSCRRLALLREALTLVDASGEKMSGLECLEQLAETMADTDLSAAAVLFGFVDAQRRAMDAPPFDPGGSLGGALAATRGGHTAETYLAAWTSGQGMSFAQAVAYALRASTQECGPM